MWIARITDQPNVKDELDLLFPREKSELHADFATIICFLADRPMFERVFNVVSDDLSRDYEFRKSQLGLKGSLSYSLLTRFLLLDRASDNSVGCQFQCIDEDIVVSSDRGIQAIAKNVVLTGNAMHLFGGIVSKGYLFKDATGPSHGEYAHTIQWLTIAYAKYYREIRLSNPVVKLYTNAVGSPKTSFSLGELQTLDADTDAPTKLSLPYWSLLVDCFRSSELYGQPEWFGKNLFVENYRSPGYLTDQMLHRRLRRTFLGEHLQKRYNDEKRHGKGFVTGATARNALREYALSKQLQKHALGLSGHTTNATIPPYLESGDKAFFEDMKSRTTRNKGIIKDP